MQNRIFSRADILVRKEKLDKWATIACDQFTSDEKYWNDVKNYVGNEPSAYNIIFPEFYLNKISIEKKKKSIKSYMQQYLAQDIFDEYKNSYIYVERTLLNGSIRKGIIGKIDLCEYDYNKDSKTAVRPTEGTIIDRLPPRVKIREGAIIESPHILILINDKKKEIIESLSAKKQNFKKLYDFELMMGGGNIKAYLIDDETADDIENKLDVLRENAEDNLVFATGDGNHSLATAKKCYENILSEKGKEYADASPFRYALVEINNIHDDSLKFEPIHRAVFDIDKKHFIENLKIFCEGKDRESKFENQYFYLLDKGEKVKYEIKNPPHNLCLGSVQLFLDDYIKKNNSSIDYLHTLNEVNYIVEEKNGLGILLESIEKDDLFHSIVVGGSLPRKTFSMGEAQEKKYYVECRKL